MVPSKMALQLMPLPRADGFGRRDDKILCNLVVSHSHRFMKRSCFSTAAAASLSEVLALWRHILRLTVNDVTIKFISGQTLD